MNFSPIEYAEAAVVAREAAEEMLSRLDWMTIQPKVILDVGCGAGVGSLLLRERFQAAKVIALDLNLPMVQHVQENIPTADGVCASLEKLPFHDHSVDLIFANFVLPWQGHLKILLKEWLRVLTPNGLLMLTTLGLDTLKEWRGVLRAEHLPNWIDMHDIGDELLHAGFADPVLDVNYCEVTYRDQARLMQDLSGSGLWFPDQTVSLQTITPPPRDENGCWPLTYEIIYAHAFVPEARNEFAPEDNGIVKIPLAHLRRRLTG